MPITPLNGTRGLVEQLAEAVTPEARKVAARMRQSYGLDVADCEDLVSSAVLKICGANWHLIQAKANGRDVYWYARSIMLNGLRDELKRVLAHGLKGAEQLRAKEIPRHYSMHNPAFEDAERELGESLLDMALTPEQRLMLRELGGKYLDE